MVLQKVLLEWGNFKYNLLYREFFRQINGKNISASNPDCKKELIIEHGGEIIPKITIEWIDNSKTIWETQYDSLIDIFTKVRIKTKEIEFNEYKEDWEEYKKKNLKEFKEIIKEKYSY